MSFWERHIRNCLRTLHCDSSEWTEMISNGQNGQNGMNWTDVYRNDLKMSRNFRQPKLYLHYQKYNYQNVLRTNDLQMCYQQNCQQNNTSRKSATIYSKKEISILVPLYFLLLSSPILLSHYDSNQVTCKRSYHYHIGTQFEPTTKEDLPPIFKRLSIY